MSPDEFSRWLAYFKVKAELEAEAMDRARRQNGVGGSAE